MSEGLSGNHIGSQNMINKKFQRKNVNIFLLISFNICFGCSKKTRLGLIETLLLSTCVGFG